MLFNLVFGVGGIYGVSRIVPTGFLPEEDQGAFFVMVQLPDGASVARTSAADATKKAMAQITAPIIAITLVLLSVFVPIAFIPGLSGT